jgi:glyoxylase-like metal-dependent hydrolase (beta-lactamase superfamily II)
MKEVAPGIYQLSLPLIYSSLNTVNIYLVRGNDGYLLIDAGWNIKEAFDSLQKQTAEIGVNLEDIAQIVITHVHPDHYGMAGRLKQISQAKIAMHHLEKDIIERRYVNLEQLLQQLAQWLKINGVSDKELPRLQQSSAVTAQFVLITPPDVTLDDGETIVWGAFNFQVLWTPGHSPGHISLYERDKRILLSGDYILPSITPHISLNPYQVGTSPLDNYLQSLARTKRLKADLVLPGHEQPFHDLAGRIDEIIRHHDQRNSEILNALATGEKTAYEIATQMTWMSDIGGISWRNLSAMDRRLAVLETLSHLESMRLQGKVDKSLQDDIIYYRRV